MHTLPKKHSQIAFIAVLKVRLSHGRHDTQDNDIQPNDTQHNDLQHTATQ
jgi:hypothetical protein